MAIVYETTYDNDGNGLVSFIDTNDGGKQYMYTQFEPYYATRVFPCFDQPDLKATMELSIVAPGEWNILSNEYSTLEEEFSAEKFVASAATFHGELLKEFGSKCKGKMSLFPKTKTLPTYLFCFVAGPYERLKL